VRRAVLVLSGGQDSATCGLMTRYDYLLHTLSFNYGQRHLKELDHAARVSTLLGAVDHRVQRVEFPGETSSLTDKDVPREYVGKAVGTLPNTFVPGRNLLFLTVAAIHAAGIRQRYNLDYLPPIITGVCETDFSGYPDCRDETVTSLAKALSLGMDTNVRILTPLMWMNKKDTVLEAASHDGWREVIGETWTCYRGEDVPCGECPACVLRRKGFEEAGINDPAQAKFRTP
jgi:7-cyano-7-deazaguanine synthase